MCYSEQYLEDTSQQMDSGIAAWKKCFTVNIMWNFGPWGWESYEKNSLFWSLSWAMSHGLISTVLNFDWTTSSIAKVKKFFIPIWKVNIRSPTQKVLNQNQLFVAQLGNFQFLISQNSGNLTCHTTWGASLKF